MPVKVIFEETFPNTSRFPTGDLATVRDSPPLNVLCQILRICIIINRHGYVRYDFSTASKLLDLVKQLQQSYGTLTELHKKAENTKDLENRLMQFKGIGPVTANIFLRELRAVWKKADPEPLDIVKEQAAKLGITLNKFHRKTKRFIKLEAALIRSSKQKKRKPSLKNYPKSSGF